MARIGSFTNSVRIQANLMFGLSLLHFHTLVSKSPQPMTARAQLHLLPSQALLPYKGRYQKLLLVSKHLPHPKNAHLLRNIKSLLWKRIEEATTSNMNNGSHHDWKLITEMTSQLKTAPENWSELTAETRNTFTNERSNTFGVNIHLRVTE